MGAGLNFEFFDLFNTFIAFFYFFLKDGCKREFTEETGMEGTVEALLCVEVQGAGWYRMAFAVHIVGGELIKEPNAE